VAVLFYWSYLCLVCHFTIR